MIIDGFQKNLHEGLFLRGVDDSKPVDDKVKKEGFLRG